MIEIVIADDDPIVREGLKMIISSQPDLCVAGEAADGNEALGLCRRLRPGVAMLDIRMPGCDGITAAEGILAEKLSAPLLLTTFDEEEFILRALKSGVNGYILKNSPAGRIVNAIRTVSTGGTVFQEDILKFIRGRIVGQGGSREIFGLLSPRADCRGAFQPGDRGQAVPFKRDGAQPYQRYTGEDRAGASDADRSPVA